MLHALTEDPDKTDRPSQHFLKLILLISNAEKLDQNIPSALQVRKSCSCPPLPHVDPRHDYFITRLIIEDLDEEELKAVRQLESLEAKAAMVRDLAEKKHAERVGLLKIIGLSQFGVLRSRGKVLKLFVLSTVVETCVHLRD